MQIIAGIILLGVLIFFHELGHFLFAKMLGVRVLVFSIGFGPKLIGIKKGDTEYRLSIIPLGGYIRMFGESLEENFNEEEKKLSFLHQAVWRKSLIAFAGPLFNFILPLILFFGLLIGTEQILAPVVGTLLEDGAAKKAGILVDDRILAVNNQAIESFNDMADFVSKHPNEELTFLIERKSTANETIKLNIIVTPKAHLKKNPLEKSENVGRIGIMPAIEKPVIVVPKDSPYYSAGLRDFDEIIAINGEPVKSAHELLQLLNNLAQKSVIKLRREDIEELSVFLPVIQSADLVKNKETRLQVDKDFNQDDIEKTLVLLKQEEALEQKIHGLALAKGSITQVEVDGLGHKMGLNVGDRIIAIDGQRLSSSFHMQQILLEDLAAHHILGIEHKNGDFLVISFKLPPDIAQSLSLDTSLSTLMGITLTESFLIGQMIERSVGPIEASKRAFKQTSEIVVLTAKSLLLLIKGDVPASQIGGPIMLFDVAQQAAKKGLPYYIFIMCLLSVNLGLLNLLPIPGLDGGHLLLFGIEAVQRKPLTTRTRAVVTQIGLLLLLLVMAVAIFNDLSRLFR